MTQLKRNHDSPFRVMVKYSEKQCFMNFTVTRVQGDIDCAIENHQISFMVWQKIGFDICKIKIAGKNGLGLFLFHKNKLFEL